MKKYIPFLTLAVFPNYIALYFIAGLLISSAINIGALNPFSNASLVINGILYLCSVIVSVIGIVWLNRKKEAFEDVFTINLIIKVSHIPGNILIAFIIIFFALTIVGIGLAIELLLVCFTMLILSGSIGCIGIRRLVKQKVISKGEGIVHYIFQFVFCMDIVNALALYYKYTKVNNAEKNNV